MYRIDELFCCFKLDLFSFGLWISVISYHGCFSVKMNGINFQSLDNFVCSPNEVEDTKNHILSDMQCMYACALNENCKMVFFHQGDGTCVMCNNTHNLQVYLGTKYIRPAKATSCAKFFSFNGIVSGTFTAEVDPDGDEPQFGEISVPCDLDSEPGKATMVLNHDKETRTRVKGYDQCNSYRVTLTYDVGLEAAKKIANGSIGCKQHVKYECYNSAVFTDTGLRCVAWENRLQDLSLYFTGNGSGTYYCDCEPTGSCSAPNGCKCGYNDNTWRFDDGYITNKEHLPITAFTAGDTEDGGETGYHTIGPLLCW